MPYGKVTDPVNFSMNASYHSESHHHGNTDERDRSQGELGNREKLRGQPHSFVTTHSGQESLTNPSNLYQSFPRTLPSTVLSH